MLLVRPSAVSLASRQPSELETSAVVGQVGAYADVEKAKASRNIRRGKGKMRNRRYVGRKGPLVVFGEEGAIGKAFRNLPGVEVSSVDSLNLLQVRTLCSKGSMCLCRV